MSKKSLIVLGLTALFLAAFSVLLAKQPRSRLEPPTENQGHVNCERFELRMSSLEERMNTLEQQVQQGSPARFDSNASSSSGVREARPTKESLAEPDRLQTLAAEVASLIHQSQVESRANEVARGMIDYLLDDSRLHELTLAIATLLLDVQEIETRYGRSLQVLPHEEQAFQSQRLRLIERNLPAFEETCGNRALDAFNHAVGREALLCQPLEAADLLRRR